LAAAFCCFSDPESKNINNLSLIAPGLARDARGRFAKGSSGNPRGRPPGIPNPKRRIPDLVARPLSAQALSALLDRKPHLLRPLAAQLMPSPPAATDPMKRLGIDLPSRPTPADVHGLLHAVLTALAPVRSRSAKPSASHTPRMPRFARCAPYT
jgi:hypothetical protein